MTKYEICVVLGENLEEEQRNQELQKIKDYITRFNGTVIDPVEDWGKKKFAYEINGKKEGYYTFITFDGDENTAQQLENQVRIMENVVRYLIVKKQPEVVKEKKED